MPGGWREQRPGAAADRVQAGGKRPLRAFVLGMIGVGVFVLVVLPLAVLAAFRALRRRLA